MTDGGNTTTRRIADLPTAQLNAAAVDPAVRGATGALSGIEVQLDRIVTAGSINGRHDLSISGLVVADRPMKSVGLLLDGQIVALALFGRTATTQEAFRLVLAQKELVTTRQTSLEIVAQSQGGIEQRTALTFMADSTDPRIVEIVEGPVCDLPLAVKASAPVQLYVERAALDRRGGLHVSGWAVAHMQIVALQIFADELRVGSALLGGTREDIASAYPTYPNARLSGFSFSGRLGEDAAPLSIAVEAIDLHGSVNRVVVPAELGIEPPHGALPAPTSQLPSAPDPRRTLFLHCDQASLSTDGQLLVSGWAVCATGLADVAVRLDGEFIGDAELGLPRTDVGDEYPGIPQARHSGFRLMRHVAISDSSQPHQVQILARNGMDDTRECSIPVVATSAAVIPFVAESNVDGEEFRFQLDGPVVIAGAAPDLVAGRLVVEGWALARSGIESIEVLLDERSLGQAYYGTARRDVEAAFPEWENALRCGFIFHCPPRALESGAHTIRLHISARNARTFDSEFRINVQQCQDAEDYATIRRHLSRAEIDLYSDIIDRLNCRATFLLVLVARAPLHQDRLLATLRSLRAQAFTGWQLLIVTDARDLAAVSSSADSLELHDRTTVLRAGLDQGAFLSEAIVADGCFIGVLSAGDELGCDALAEFAIAHGLHREVEFFYADEDRVSPASGMREPYFKPGWSPDLLLSTNYIGRPWFASAALFAKASITPRSLLASQSDYDAVLRCTELTSRIRHVPMLLSRRDDWNGSSKSGERRALRSATRRRGIKAELQTGCIDGTWRVKRTTPAKGKVSIIIPTCAAQGHIATCLQTLRANTAYRNVEIICIDNIPDDLPKWKKLVRKDADKVVEISESFNWSRFNNRAAVLATGEYLLFLNDDIEVERDDWLDAMLEHVQRPEVGVVGPQLLYPDRKVQHAGIFLTTLGAGRHSFRFLAEDDPGYFGLALTQRNVIAVTGACMLTRRDVFESLGHFDEAHEVVNNDVDFCLRAWQEGLSVVYTPYAQLIHHELASRAKIKDVFNAEHFARLWRRRYAIGDPFFSPRLTKFADEYRPDTEPARMICAGRPLFQIEDIERILVVKLDHIGDFITALPALRRLRRHFPSARIHLLAPAATRSFLEDEDCIDEVIEFAFYHARSDRGETGVTEEDLAALGRRLEPYRFDLAIDLRKQLETRHVLRSIPARFRAGYDHLGRFPWLDVTLEWEGDDQLRRKHSHVSDDLLRLVDAIVIAGETDRAGLPQRGADGATLPVGISAEARALFARPVVAVHPGVGAVMRQWPVEHFASVIDLLIEEDAVNVVLIGGPDEAELAEAVLGQVVNQPHVVSLAGRTSLIELRGLLRACALYLGNNSGPKHIAAALGVPTVGVHSGVVDATEWGPVGPRAIAVQKNMICSPCYLVKPEDCVRDLACMKRLEPGVVHRYCQMMLARRTGKDVAVDSWPKLPFSATYRNSKSARLLRK